MDVTAVPAVTPEEAPALLKEVYRRSNIKKPRNLVGLSKDLPAADMEGLLLQAIPVDEDTVRGAICEANSRELAKLCPPPPTLGRARGRAALR